MTTASWVVVKGKPIAMFTPLPPSRTGTADYAADLLSELSKQIDVQVFDRVPRWFKPSEFRSLVYQIANNPFHADIYKMALRHPGVVVLHECNLHQLIRSMYAGRSDAYLREIHYEIFGHERLPDNVVHRSEAKDQTKSLPMLRRLLDRSQSCIVHSRAAENIVRSKGFRGPIGRIPHGVTVREAPRDARSELGLSHDEPLIGLFGYLRPDKLACESLKVFKRLLLTEPDAHMVIAGKPHPEVPLERLIETLGLSNRVHLLRFQTLTDLDAYIGACDIVLNLRWPSFAESSGITARAFGMGRAVIVADHGAHTDLPPEVCARIPCDQYRDEVLLETLKWLIAEPQTRREVGAAAVAWASENTTWRHTATRYATFLTEARVENTPAIRLDSTEELRRYLSLWSAATVAGAQYFHQHENRLGRTLQLVPTGTHEDRILELGCYLQITPALRTLLGYGEVRGSYYGSGGSELKCVTSASGEQFDCLIDLFDCESSHFPYPDGWFSTVLCCELLEHLIADPMHMMSQIRRILKPDGTLLLTTPNITSLRSVDATLRGQHPSFYSRYPRRASDGTVERGHHREYTPGEIHSMLHSAGFTVEHMETGAYGPARDSDYSSVETLLKSRGMSTALRDDCVFAVARKTSLPVDRYPTWLYDA